MIDKTREIALKTLYKIDQENAYSNIALNEIINQNKKELTPKDIGFISEIVYGTTTWKLTIDEIIKKYSNIKIKKISSWILNILRMGIYQIVFLDKIPKSAAVNESVNLAKRYGHKSSSNFTNAILRKVQKQDYIEMQNIPNDIERISKTTSMPVWIIENLLKEKNIKDVEEICKASNIKPKICIRVNNLKTTKDELKQILQNKKIECSDGVLEDFIIVKNIKNIENFDEFKKGLFTIQDEAAGLTAIILDCKSGERVLDACSAPGGKTTYIAELTKNKTNIEAWDIHYHRTQLVNENAKRLGITSITEKVNDATTFDESCIEKFDKILLDVPCLGIGVLKRKPDIKWKKQKSDIKEITNIQKNILNNCSKYLKKGGKLVYSTCSICSEENIEIIEEFIEKNKEFEVEKVNLEHAKYFEKYLKNSKYLQVYQNEETDGFFIAKLIKK